MRVQRVKPQKHFGFSTSGGHINSLKWTKTSKLMYFEHISMPICFNPLMHNVPKWSDTL